MRFTQWLYLKENKLYQPNSNSVIVGVEHGQPINIDEASLNKIQDLARYGTYFEGDYPEEMVKSFISRYLPDTHLASWEPPKHTIPEISSVAISLFGGETNVIVKQVSHNPQLSIRDNLLQNSNEWHGSVNEEILDKILQIANLQRQAQQPCTSENFYKFHTLGHNLMFNQWTCNSSNNPLQALQAQANKIRDQHLLQMVNKGGVFFVGHNHIDCIKNLLH
jgi:hypothetical protein